MAQELAGVTLTAPSSDPNIDEAQTFQMSATYSVAGHGGEEDVSLYWEFGPTGGPYSLIPTSGDDLSTPTNPTTGTDSTVTHSVTITGDLASANYVHVRAVGNSSSNSYENGNQVVTVNAGAQTYNESMTLAMDAGVSGATVLVMESALNLDTAVAAGTSPPGSTYNIGATLAASAGLTAAPALVIDTAAVLAATSALSSVGGTGLDGAVSLAVLAGVSSVAALNVPVSVTLDAAAGVAMLSTMTAESAVSLAAVGGLAITAGTVMDGVVTLDVAAVMAALAGGVFEESAAFALGVSVNVAGTLVIPGDITLAGDVGNQVAAQMAAGATMTLDVTPAVAALGFGDLSAAAVFAINQGIDVAGVVVGGGTIYNEAVALAVQSGVAGAQTAVFEAVATIPLTASVGSGASAVMAGAVVFPASLGAALSAGLAMDGEMVLDVVLALSSAGDIAIPVIPSTVRGVPARLVVKVLAPSLVRDVADRVAVRGEAAGMGRTVSDRISRKVKK